ncbi:anaerobic sulfatase maturase [Lachnospiraceae bacterium 3-1]|nr:anaerobic sulfatase maturase [Lachnospiraceae bacterium 3-1]
MPPISVLIKPSSGMCNMTCDYCFYCDETQKRAQESYGFMSETTLKNVIRKTMLRAEGTASYTFQGGEPTLRGLDFFEKVLSYQKQYNKNKIQVYNSLQTNGLLIDEAWCRFLRENHFLTGISLDGIQKTHDACRHSRKDNTPTFDRICRSIALLETHHVDFNILTVVNQTVAQNIQEIYAFYRQKKWNYQQYIACLDPFHEPHGQNSYSIHPENYGQFLTELFHLWYKDWKKNRQPYIRQFENYIGILLGHFPESCDQRGTCSIQYVVEADGSVYPCDFYMMDEYCLGNFNENRLEEIDAKRREIAFLKRSLLLDPSCKLCTYYPLCKGGCQRNRDWNPEIEAYQNYFCQSYRMFFDACLDGLMEVANSLSHAPHKFCEFQNIPQDLL